MLKKIVNSSSYIFKDSSINIIRNSFTSSSCINFQNKLLQNKLLQNNQKIYFHNINKQENLKRKPKNKLQNFSRKLDEMELKDYQSKINPIRPIKKNYMIKVIKDIFIKGVDNGISRIRHTYDSDPKSNNNHENKENDEKGDKEKNTDETSPINLKSSFDKLNISTKDLKAKSEELIKLIRTNFDKYNLDDIFQLLLIMYHFKIRDFDLMMKIEKRISNSFMDMKQDNQAKIIYYFGSLDYFSNKFYFLTERFLIKNLDSLNNKNFLLIIVSLGKNPFLSPGLITLMETYIEKKFNDFKLNEIVEIFINLSKIYDRFSYYFDETKKYHLFRKIWQQINTHLIKITSIKLIDIYFMVFSIDSKKLKNKKHIKELKILDDIEDAKIQIFQILNTFYINFYHRENYHYKNDHYGEKIQTFNNANERLEQSELDNLLEGDKSIIDVLIKKDKQEKQDENSEVQKAHNSKIVHKLILTHHFGEDNLFNFSDLYNKDKTSDSNIAKEKENYKEQVDHKIKTILETQLPKLNETDITTIFKTISEPHFLNVFENSKEIDINTEVLKFNFFIYNEILKNMEVFLPEESNSIFSILLMHKFNKKKFLFLNHEANLAFLLQKFLETTQKDYLFMSVEEQCLYLQTIFEILKYKSESEEFKKVKKLANEIFHKIEKEIQERRIKRLKITQVVPVLDVYKYIGRNHFKLLDQTLLMDHILFLLENETSDNFEDLFDDYYHISLLLNDLIDEAFMLEDQGRRLRGSDFWKEFSKYSKLFLNSKKIDQKRLKKLYKLLDDKSSL